MIPEIETQSAVKIKMFQELKLKEMLSYISEHSTYYKNLFKSENIKKYKSYVLAMLALKNTISSSSIFPSPTLKE